ncbi:lyase family protein [Phytoactinopolyspora limicola]|uniref:lyase family protein n=1 Tax=Phytoactinopolyspora limicola TaxID=2715536 RepID=UPI001A9CA426|nr:lyase family protein [Phytoactinopolyspora limicola]
MSDIPFLDAVFSRGDTAARVSSTAWVQAMIDVESALAHAQAHAGVIPGPAAAAVSAARRAVGDADHQPPRGQHPGLDETVLTRAAESAAATGTPVGGVVQTLRDQVGPEHARFVHYGATSQDILDTAAMLITRRALQPLRADLMTIGTTCADLAERHRGTVMAGRTLLQQAVPITFGLKAARWLVAIDDAITHLDRVRDTTLAVQYGGAAGTLAPLGDHGPAVMDALAATLGLVTPALPWHGDRTRVADIGAALGVAAGTCGKIATDVTLLAQTEVAEVAEVADDDGPVRRGGSTAMPHKQNPVAAVAAAACARRVPALVSTLLAAMAGEHERAAGAWHAEWETLRDLLRLTGSTANWLTESLTRLEIDPARMRANLAPALNKLLDGPDPLGAADTFIDRALLHHRSQQ